MNDGHWTYSEWEKNTIEKIVTMGLAAPDKDHADYLRVQIRSAIQQAFRHGRSGRAKDDPVVA
jgi:hypothetical protein